MTDRLHLQARHREQLEALFREHLPEVEVWAYGSRVDGRGHDGSDLDLVLRGPGLDEIDLARLDDFQRALHDSTIPFLVEARDWARLPERFHREIERGYAVFARSTQRCSADQHLFTCLPRGWEVTTLGSASSRGGGGIQTGPFGSQLHASDYVPAGIPAVMPKDIGDNRIEERDIARISPEDARRLDRYLVRPGDILYSRRGDVGKRALVRPSQAGWLCGTGCLRVRFGEDGVDPRYATYFMGHPLVREWIVRHAHGATMPNLNTSILSACPFVTPPIDEQRAIAHVLGTLDDKIELNRRMNEMLEAMARALFKSWFVDFDPVRARMEGRETGLPEDLAELFPDRLVDSELGEIPEGWEVAPLKDLIDVNPKRSLRRGEVVPYLPMANMPTRGHVPIAVDVRAFGSGMRYVNGDTLVARITPCLENGKTAFVDFLREGEVGWGSTEYIVLRPKPPLPGQFAYCLARNSTFRDFAIQNMSGTSGRQRVPAGAVREFLMVRPPRELATAFGEVAEVPFERAKRAGLESRTLAALRDILLPKLVSGEIRVRDAENLVESPASAPRAPPADAATPHELTRAG